MRPSWDEYYLGIAESVSVRADCTRRKAGSIIVLDHHILGQGYNGAPAGEPGCLTAGACPRGRHLKVPYIVSHGWFCLCGRMWPCPEAVQPYASYKEGPGRCIATHSEDNALRKAKRAGLDVTGATFYMVPGAPCDDCSGLIRDAHVARVVWPGGSYHIPPTT